jgi:hypothetical protein
MPVMQNPLVTGYLNISGADYQAWDLDPSANAWAYDWAAAQLNLVIVPSTTTTSTTLSTTTSTTTIQ